MKIEVFASAEKDFPKKAIESLDSFKAEMEKSIRKRLELRQQDEVKIWVEK